MVLIFRWLLRGVLALLATTGIAILGAYWLASRSLPDYDDQLSLEGLSGPVEIVRDNANVPHILAETDADAFFALGFAHAQDRLWQMLTLRRTAQGRLSEIFGTRTVEIDDLMRRLDLYGAAVASVEDQDADTTMALNAYAAGVNAWLGEVNAGARGRGAPEFWLFEPVIAPWQAADSIAIGKLMALSLTDQLEQEALRLRVGLLLSPDQLRDILPDDPGSGIAVLPEFADVTPQGASQYALYDEPLSPISRRGFNGASNAWAAAPSRSASGGTLLASDPHLGFQAPSVWYLARIELSTGGVIGATIPGAPVVLLGRSDRLGWGMTASAMDDQDLFLERLNPDNPEEVATPTGFKPLVTRQSIIRLSDAPPVTATLRFSENGPIIPGKHFDLGDITPPGHVMALAWPGLSRDDTSMSGFIALMRSASIEDALAAGKAVVSPSLNMVVADQSRIAMKTLGAMPRRRATHESQGRIPAPGWKVQNRWNGYFPYASNPEFVDPIGGILGNTNNKIIDRPFPNHMSFVWGDTQRVQRWRRLMQSRAVHTRESFIEAQLDTVSFTARSLLPLVAADLWYQGDAAPQGTIERKRREALDLLAAWNGEMNEHLPEPLLYAAWMRHLQDRLIRDELGPVADEFKNAEPLFLERVFRDIDGASRWCDIVPSDAVETCTDIARLALDDALLWIEETYGNAEIQSLRWGDAHEARQDHPALGDVPVLSWVVNIRQSTSGGDNTLQRGLTSGEGENPFLNVHGSGYRGVYDFADPDSSVFVISTGQSGHPLSRYYDDLGELWRRGEYIPMSLDIDLARGAAVGVTVLSPKN